MSLRVREAAPYRCRRIIIIVAVIRRHSANYLTPKARCIHIYIRIHAKSGMLSPYYSDVCSISSLSGRTLSSSLCVVITLRSDRLIGGFSRNRRKYLILEAPVWLISTPTSRWDDFNAINIEVNQNLMEIKSNSW